MVYIICIDFTELMIIVWRIRIDQWIEVFNSIGNYGDHS